MVIIDFVRHAQGYHNLCKENWSLPDPNLTPLGEEQCKALKALYPYHDTVKMLVASPLRRTLQTALQSFEPAADRGLVVLALPELQEVSALPSDVGSARSTLEKEFTADQVDLSRVQPAWNYKGKGSPYAVDLDALTARGRSARLSLRALTKGLGPDDRIAVVTHGGFLHFMTQDYDGMVPTRGTGWQNTEWRAYEFADPTGADADAALKETAASWERRRGTAQGMTAQEQLELQLAYHHFLTEELGIQVEEDLMVKFTDDYEAAQKREAAAEAKARA
ncbi:phosphoglycerate mutase family protein [Ophiostoma piceae UAMH 11346]|uniref:Phosphoglycerate mutase family protein n=1 Tax=Ophiostoma piceae (strain UAMH 11346) TaxID=1262450 RepID=S3BZ32_OPHP1|nr:phosphoglycerate mutase family protein [Ophiostoma piceae UAMH 11346]